MWTFIGLSLHQLTDSKAQLNKTNVANQKYNNIARSYQEDTGVTGKLWQTGYYKQVSYELFHEGGNRFCTANIIRKIIPNLGNIKSKTVTKVFDWHIQWGVERRNCQILMIRATVTVRVTTKRRGWSRIAKKTTV